MNLHTPGPWALTSSCAGQLACVASGDKAILEMWQPSLEDLANAQLIAAAPELLDCLREHLEGRTDTDRIRSAIGKALDIDPSTLIPNHGNQPSN